MSAGRRLGRLLPALDPRERVLMALRAWKAGERPDARLVWSVPVWQVDEYNRWADVLEGTTGGFTHYVGVVCLLIDRLEFELCVLQMLRMWGVHAAAVIDFLNASEPVSEGEEQRVTGAISLLGRAPIGLTTEPPSLRLPADGDDNAENWTAEPIAASVIERLRCELPSRYQELRAAELVLDELAATFGEDILDEDVRSKFETCRLKLSTLRTEIEVYTGFVDLGEPTPQLLAHARALAGLDDPT